MIVFFFENIEVDFVIKSGYRTLYDSKLCHRVMRSDTIYKYFMLAVPQGGG